MEQQTTQGNGSTAGSGNLADMLVPPTQDKLDKPAALPAVQLEAARDFTLIRESLVHRADALDSLAKKNETDGYHRAAREIKGDAERARHGLIPKFAPQGALPFTTSGELNEKIAAAMSLMTANLYEGIGPKSKFKVTEGGLKHRRERLVKELTEQVSSYVVEASRLAFEAGHAQSRTTPEHYAMKAIDMLRDRAD